MQGPTAATMRSRRAPWRSMAATVASTTPPRAPRQPAWALATTRASPSASRIGAQSADRAPRARPGRAVTRPSPSGGLSHRPVTVCAVAEWIW